MTTSEHLAAALKTRAAGLGFDFAGVCEPAPSARDAAAFRRWLASGMHAEMAYMARDDRVQRALSPSSGFTGVASMVVVASSYFVADLPTAWRDDPSRGIFASYAWGADYHAEMRPRLEALGEWLQSAGARRTVAYVDTGPILERDAAERAGVGFMGKNTMLIRPGAGSWLFLGALLTDLTLAPDPPYEGGTCGRCRRCLTACPTDAFPRPYVLDSRLCISYLTIEHRGIIPRELRPGLGNRVFGCDICNESCPYNRRPAREAVTSPLPEALVAPPLLELVALDEAAFGARYAVSAVRRTRRAGLVRNACVAIGNWGSPEALAAVRAALGDQEPLVRAHAAWAVGRIGGPAARRALERARRREPEHAVVSEIDYALSGGGAPTKARRTRSTSPASDSGNMAGRPDRPE